MRYLVLALVWPHVSRWLKIDRHISESTFALIFLSVEVVSLLTQPLWGLAADRARRRRSVLRILVLGSGVAYIALGRWGGQLPLAGIWLLLLMAALLQNTSLPILNSIVLRFLGHDRMHRFAYYRVMGSISFMVVLLATPLLLDTRFLGLSRATLFQIGGVLAILSVFLMQWAPQRHETMHLRPGFGDLRLILREHNLLFLYLALVIFNICFGGLYMYIGPYFAVLHGSEANYSLSYGLNVLGEVPMSFLAPVLVRRWGMKRLAGATMLYDAVRYTLIAFAPNAMTLSVIWALGGPPTVGYIVILPMLIAALAPAPLRSTAQNVSASIASLGSIVGLTVISYTMHHYAGEQLIWGYRWLFLRMAIGAAIAGCVVLWLVKEKQRQI